MATKAKLTFEEALEKLELSAENLRSDNVSLDDALKSFEQGIEYYNHCNKILDEAQQKIEVYNKQ